MYVHARLFQSQRSDPNHSSISPGTFSSLPTNPRDWMVVDALPERISQWQVNALYIIGDKAVLQHVPEDLYPNCTFVPVVVCTTILIVVIMCFGQLSLYKLLTSMLCT